MGVKVALRRLRTGLPRPLRWLYRVAMSLRSPSYSKAIPDDLILDCQFVSSRVAMLDRLPRGGRIAELGTQRGNFAVEILARSEPKELHLIDIDLSGLTDPRLRDARVFAHCGWAHEQLAAFPDGYFDWVYVDADHSYEGTMRDARAAAAKIKPGGFLVFNDFAHIDVLLGRYGVHRAVVDFAIQERWPLRLFAFAPHALYDVALQRPDQRYLYCQSHCSAIPRRRTRAGLVLR
jgi:Methyltransferase domain